MSMARMSNNAAIPRRDYGYSSQLTHWVLDSGATCHMTPDISYCIPAHLWKQINISMLNMGIFHSKKNRISSNKMRDNNVKPFVATLNNLLLSPDLCN